METPKLSTMVVLYNTNLLLDTTYLLEHLPLTTHLIRIEKRGVLLRGESSRDKIRRRSKKEEKKSNTGFGHNSITLVMLNDGNGALPKKEITVKIFQNGVFHLTGVLDERYDKDTMNKLLAILQKSCQESYRDTVETAEILSRRVVLMNYTTKLTTNDTVPREALHNSIRTAKLENVMSYYDPDVYPGVKIHVGTDNWTAKVFRTGKIILTGITCEDDCKSFMIQLLALFEQVLPKKQTLAYMSDKVALP